VSIYNGDAVCEARCVRSGKEEQKMSAVSWIEHEDILGNQEGRQMLGALLPLHKEYLPLC
jgi:hypothetical protein